MGKSHPHLHFLKFFLTFCESIFFFAERTAKSDLHYLARHAQLLAETSHG